MAQFGDKVAKDAEPQAHGAVDELNAAGKHIKKSANLAGQAAHDAYQSATSSAKKETNELASEVDKFRQEHHLKEGDRTPEDVLSHKYNQAADKASSKVDEWKQDANEAAFKAADKFKDAKASASSSSGRSVDHNPMVEEKASAGKTKSSYERGLEHHAKENVRDTSNLVGKDTDKVKKVWDDKNSQEHPSEEKSKGFWSSLVGGSGASNEAAPPKSTTNRTPSVPYGQPEKKIYDTAPTDHGNPMVHEKHNIEKTKPGWETRLENYAEKNVHDTSTLVGKDTEKVRGVWDEKHVRDNGGVPVAQENSNSFWSSLFGQAKEAEHKVEERLEEGWEDVKSKVGLSTHDVKKDASEAYEDAKGKASAEASRLKRSASNTANDLSHKAESKWNNLKSQVKDDAQSAYDSAADASSNVSSKLKRETSRVSSETQSKAEELKRNASDRLEAEKHRASSNLKDLHNEVSSNAEKWKDQTEQTAKSWYQKGTEQIKSGLENVKSTADKDLHWAEDKVSEGLATAKTEVDRLLGKEVPKETSYTDHVIRGEKFAQEEEGMLGHTHTNTKLKPAEVVVGNADGKEM